MARQKVLFRWSNNNHYTLAALIGLIDDKLDADKFEVGTLEHLEDFNPKESPAMLGYSFMTPDSKKVFAEIRRFKRLYGSSLTVICGGPHASALPESCIEAGADFVFTGEAEESLPAFLKRHREDPSSIKDRVIAPAPLKDFNSYPPFAYKRKFFGPIELRRGCTNRCVFCQTPSLFRKVRERNAGYVMEYASYIKKAGRERVLFTISDALLYGADGRGVDLAAIEELLAGLKGMGMKPHLGNFPSEVSPDTLVSRPEAAALLAKYVANRKIVLGGQSGSNKVLKLMGRKHSAADTAESVRILHSAGFAVIVDILFGVPGEKREDRRLTLKLMETLSERYSAKFNVHYFMPLPGSPFAGMDPETVENPVKEAVRRLIKDGVARGDFFKQLDYATRLRTAGNTPRRA